jgi:hypothetical protein
LKFRRQKTSFDDKVQIAPYSKRDLDQFLGGGSALDMLLSKNKYQRVIQLQYVGIA